MGAHSDIASGFSKGERAEKFLLGASLGAETAGMH